MPTKINVVGISVIHRFNGKDPQCSTYHEFIPLIYDLQVRERLKLMTDSRMIQFV
jgi:uncharacterized protein